MDKLIIDRFEGTYAVCEREDKSMIKLPKYRLPIECKEGDCIILDANGMYQKDTEATKLREKSMKDKMNRLFE